MTLFDSQTKTLEGPEDKLEIINKFPLDQYEIVLAQEIDEFFS